MNENLLPAGDLTKPAATDEEAINRIDNCFALAGEWIGIQDWQRVKKLLTTRSHVAPSAGDVHSMTGVCPACGSDANETTTSTTPQKPEAERDALRHGQALAVVPLVGNVLTHWESLPNDLKDHIREIDDGLEKAIDAVQDAMENHEPASAASAIAEKTDDNTRVLELHAALHHSLQNTDEAIEHIEKLAAEVIQWCESAALDADNRTVWDQRIALLLRILEPEPIVATDGGKATHG